MPGKSFGVFSEEPGPAITGESSGAPRFASVEHLSLEALAAYVDGELSTAAMHRARIHLVHCQQCRNDVDEQRRAARALRDRSQAITAPAELVDRLASLANGCPAGPAGDAGLQPKPHSLIDRVDLLFHAIVRTYQQDK